MSVSSALPASAPAETPEFLPVAPDVAWPRFARESAFWSAHVCFWGTAFAATQLVIAVYGSANPGPPAMLAARVASMALATAGMRWLAKRPGLLQRLGVSRAGLVAGGLLTAAVVITLLFSMLEAFVPGCVSRPSRGRLVADLAVNVTLLANWCALYFGWHLIRERSSAEFRAVEAESLALRNELHRLQAQISPHFLFNALNTVLACRDAPDDIETVTQSLAAYLRFLLRPAATLEPLSRELDALEHYLTVQTMRFGDALQTRIDCELDVREVPVPPVLVQPLVENALKYGAETGSVPLQVEVSSRRDGDWLVVEVANTGRWVQPGGGRSTGTGLHSVERRLRLLVGPGARVTHEEREGWVRVRVRVPLSAPAWREDA